MGKLNIAHHKSYHPYKAENIERVRRDEEKAAAIAAGDRSKVLQADSEARIAMLRKQSRKGKSKEVDAAEKQLEKQLSDKGKERAEEGDDMPADPVSSITTQDGHINFWADMERGQPSKTAKSNSNADYEKDKKAEEIRWEEQVTMRIQSPPKTWYDSADRLTSTERRMTDDQRLEHTYKDNENKKGYDPFSLMKAHLARRKEVKDAQERQRQNPWADTPRTLKEDRTPVQPTLLRSRDRRRISPDSNKPAGPAKPPPSSPSDIQKVTADREASERERAKALIAAKRNAVSSTPTPRSEYGYQTGMYNREATRDAKRLSKVRW